LQSNINKSINNKQQIENLNNSLIKINEESYNNSSNLETSDFDEKIISLDNKNNLFNKSNFNAKFCDFKNNNQSNRKEFFEDFEFFVDK